MLDVQWKDKKFQCVNVKHSRKKGPQEQSELHNIMQPGVPLLQVAVQEQRFCPERLISEAKEQHEQARIAGSCATEFELQGWVSHGLSHSLLII